MYLHSLGTAVPPNRFTQQECWEIVSESHAAAKLKDRSREVLRKVLLGDSGIATRHFVTADFPGLFEADAEGLHSCFAREAPALAEQAVLKALEKAELRPGDLDGLFVCTCTGYLCPGISSYVAERLGLRPEVLLHDTVGLGCGAALPTLRNAGAFIAENPALRIACVAVEICSAAFYLDDNPGVLVSACLFSDGAAAAILGGRPRPDGPPLKIDGFRSVHLPAHREALRFENREGKLRNRLEKSVPETAATAVASLFAQENGQNVGQIIAHPGGRDVLAAIERTLPPFQLTESATVLRNFGNMSSPSVLFSLEERLQSAPEEKNESLWLVSFGAGFSCHSCRVSANANSS